MRVYKRPGGQNYQFEFEHKRQQYRESTHTANHKLACRYAERRKNEIIAKEAGLGPVDPITARLSELRERFEEWYRGAHPASARRITHIIPNFEAIFTHDPMLVDIVPFDIERWRSARLATGLERSSVQREYTCLQTMFREATTWYPGLTDPTEKVKGWKIDETEAVFLTPDEVYTALTRLPPRYALICRMTLECLPRLSEILTLTKRDLGVTPGKDGPTYWCWRRLKGGKRKRVPISQALHDDLLALLERPNQVRLFETQAKRDHKDGTKVGAWVPMGQEATSSYFTRLFKAIGLPHVSHHAFRHTGITLMLDAGRNPRAIQVLAGWTSLRMLERYGHVRDAELQASVHGNVASITDMLTHPPATILEFKR